MQGLAFWVGHRRSIYSRHELSEGALTAELCNLIHANLPSRQYRLRCEEPYTKMLPTGITREEVTENAHIDLSVWERYIPDDSQTYKQRLRFAIEVKRASAKNARIDRDLKRLAAIVEERKKVRAFLCVVSEGTRPKRFTTGDGIRKAGRVSIEGTRSVYHVLAAKKASHLFNDRDQAHYACIIEVLCLTTA